MIDRTSAYLARHYRTAIVPAQSYRRAMSQVFSAVHCKIVALLPLQRAFRGV
jgi:hypothetical protein